MPVTAVTTAVGLYTAKKGRDSAKDAARKQADAIGDSSDAAIAEQRRQFDLTRGDMMPWLDQGRDALGKQRAFLDGDWSGFMDAPDYKYAVDQGMQGLDRNAASRGSLFSGGTDLDRIGFGQGMALQNANGYWNKLAGLSNTGQVSASNLGSFGQNSANSIGNFLMDAGRGRASSYAQRGAADQDMWGNIGGIAGFLGGQWGGWGSASAPSSGFASNFGNNTGWLSGGSGFSNTPGGGGFNWLGGGG